MKVVSNTSLLCYLILIGQIDILPKLFGTVTISESVCHELKAPGAPEVVRQWIDSPPEWLQIVTVSATPDADLEQLHQGEQNAILLGERYSADVLLLDEKAARNIARARGLNVAGLIGILDRATTLGVIGNLPDVVARLYATNFHIAPRLLRHLLEKHSKSGS